MKVAQVLLVTVFIISQVELKSNKQIWRKLKKLIKTQEVGYLPFFVALYRIALTLDVS